MLGDQRLELGDELAMAPEREVGLDAVLDGEIVALDDAGVPSFGRLQQRMGVTKSADVARLRRTVPARMMLFDLLEHDGASLRDLSYDDRREALEELELDGVEITPEDLEIVLSIDNQRWRQEMGFREAHLKGFDRVPEEIWEAHRRVSAALDAEA